MTLDQLCSALPHAGDRIDRYGPALLAAMGEAQINTPLRCAHFLAQIGHESGDLRYTEEIASGDAYEGRAGLGNTQPGDGPRFKGRGFIQLTGRANYKAFGESIGRDLLADPRVVATDPALCVGVATWYWMRGGLNALADADNVRGITRRINGGFNGLPDRSARLAVAKLATFEKDAPQSA